jgi:hypothetical protein
MLHGVVAAGAFDAIADVDERTGKEQMRIEIVPLCQGIAVKPRT